MLMSAFDPKRTLQRETMKLSALRGKAKRNTIEVEHIVAAAKARVPGLGEELRRLAEEHEWHAATRLPDGSHVVPLAKWAEIAGAYADGGVDSLCHLVASPGNADYIIGLLEEIASPDAVSALIAFFPEAMHEPASAPRTAWRLVEAYNRLLSCKGGPALSNSQAETIRSFLVSCLAAATSETQRANVVYALRGVGDESSLTLLAAINDFAPPHDSARAMVMRVIRKRLLA